MDEWLELAYVGDKVIMHGRVNDGPYEAVLTAEQNEALGKLSKKQDKEMRDLLSSFVCKNG
jgi:hypothetical protein